MKTTLLSLVLVSVVAFAPASAADMYEAPPAGFGGYKDESLVASWRGFYLGVNGGYGSYNDAITLSSDPGLVSPGFITLLGKANAAAASPAGFIGGGQLGYNWQSAKVVFGVEADISGSDIKATNDASGPVGVTRFVHQEQQLDWLTTIRGRLGYTITDRLLVYGTGGVAFGGLRVAGSLTTTVANNVPACVTANIGLCMGFSESKTATGWTAGGGLEYALSGSWLLRAEYLFVDFDGVSPAGFDTRFKPPLPLTGRPANELNIVRGGVSYKFGSVYEPLK
jgi:outer membrane immunogenic protein